LVLFDPDRIIDRATFESPRLTPLGIEAVWLAGRRVVRAAPARRAELAVFGRPAGLAVSASRIP
ncbi:MAG: hypothetical protein AAGF23_05475, partial [Acidobacteriota bacterium]